MFLPDDELKVLVLKNKLIDENQLLEIEESAKKTNTSLYAALLAKDFISDEKLGASIASSIKMPFISLAKISIPAEIFHIIPERIARKYKVVVFGKDESGLKVAISDPTNRTILEMVAKKTGLPVAPYYATEKDIDETIQIYKKILQKTIDELLKEEVIKVSSSVLEEPPVAKIVDTLINAAYQDKSSDVHIEPKEDHSLIRFRIDGVLHDVLTVPRILHDRMITRIKVLSSLRTDEHLSAQDGKMRAKLEEETLDIRVSIIPVAEGEKVVLRLLSSHGGQFTLADLGMNPKDLAKVNNAFEKSFGMILSTGPTGCGKTTTIYSILKILNTREKNIMTIEDPVEYRIEGANQVQVNVKTNLTFANGLRSILRQDPNIIFVGEIRDNETAGIAVNAALTGHLVLSTLHTNDAATTIPRLTDMKVEPFLVASTVNVIIAQRLVRKICDSCKTKYTTPRSDLIKHLPLESIQKYFGDAEELTVYKGLGCKICRKTGYTGRLGIFEVLEVSKDIKKLITQKSESDEIEAAAIAEGMTSMLDDGIGKIKNGLTTIEEVIRVTKVEFT